MLPEKRQNGRNIRDSARNLKLEWEEICGLETGMTLNEKEKPDISRTDVTRLVKYN
jgi:hypothetical protein